MDHKEELQILLDMQTCPPGEQQRHVRDINRAFGVLLSLNPTEDEFQKYMHHIILTPRMLHMIWKSNGS